MLDIRRACLLGVSRAPGARAAAAALAIVAAHVVGWFWVKVLKTAVVGVRSVECLARSFARWIFCLTSEKGGEGKAKQNACGVRGRYLSIPPLVSPLPIGKCHNESVGAWMRWLWGGVHDGVGIYEWRWVGRGGDLLRPEVGLT
jgi:hypothetical protein